MYYIGIDGGGTKTAFCLIDKTGSERATIEKETCHFAQVGISGFKSIIETGIKRLLSDSNLSFQDISYTFLGIPGYGELEDKDKEMKNTLKDILQGDNFFCGNDVEASWAGSLACSPGISIVAGTGAIAYGKNSNNKSARCSGWGDFCGDEGSAYWIAKKGIEVFTKQADYRYERGPLFHTFSKELNLKDDFDLFRLVTVNYKQSRAKVAQLSKLVYDAALSGDKKAVEIFKQAAQEHFFMIKGIINQLNFSEENIPVSYTGGVFNAKDLILDPLNNYIKNEKLNCSLNAPILSPVKGAALYAMVLSGEKTNKNIIENLKK